MFFQVNGLDVCCSLCFGGDNILILIVSVKGSEMEKVIGLEVGVDDYIIKFFSLKELVVCCCVMICCQGLVGNNIVLFCKFRDLVFYFQECWVLMWGEEVSLVLKEFCLLELFMSYFC